MLRLIGLWMFESVRYAWTWNKAEYVSRLWIGSMRINVVATKVFQAVAVRYLGRSLEVNIDQVPYTNDEVQVPVVDGVEVGEVIGSGMVAVVFAGTTSTGKVVLKVKRRHIATRIDSGLRDARRILWLMQWIPSLRVLGLESVHAEVREMLHSQLDFAQEVRNQTEYRGMFSSDSSVVVPRVLEELCTEDMIVMERLTGTRAPTHRSESAEAIASAIAASIIKGIVHADLHVGNVIFMDARVGIIDFGLMLRLSDTELDAYTSIFTAGVSREFTVAADNALRFYIEPPKAMANLPAMDQLKLSNEVAKLYEKAVTDRKQFGVADVLALAALVRPHGMSIAPIFYKTMMSMAAGDLLMKDLTPEPTELLLKQVSLKLFGV